MIIANLPIEGCLKLTNYENKDNRGSSFSLFSSEELLQKGYFFSLDQVYVSENTKEGTIRGLHYQDKPFEQQKIVTCTQGSIFDVILDLREHSKTYLDYIYINLNSQFKESIYIPAGCAHGFQTTCPNTRVDYLISGKYEMNYSRGIKYNDPFFNISWPIEYDITISEQDENWGDFNCPKK